MLEERRWPITASVAVSCSPCLLLKPGEDEELWGDEVRVGVQGEDTGEEGERGEESQDSVMSLRDLNLIRHAENTKGQNWDRRWRFRQNNKFWSKNHPKRRHRSCCHVCVLTSTWAKQTDKQRVNTFCSVVSVVTVHMWGSRLWKVLVWVPWNRLNCTGKAEKQAN